MGLDEGGDSWGLFEPFLLPKRSVKGDFGRAVEPVTLASCLFIGCGAGAGQRVAGRLGCCAVCWVLSASVWDLCISAACQKIQGTSSEG